MPRRVWGATLLSALGRQWGALCTFLVLAILARKLAPDDFGRFTFYLAVLSFLDVFVDCGTSTVAVQRGASDPEAFAAALAAGRRVRAAAALLGAGIVAACAGLAHEPQLPWIWLAALGPLARVPEMSAVVFQRDIEWGRPLLLRALGGTARLLAVLALARLPGIGFGPFLAVHSLTLGLGNVALHFAARARLPRAASPMRGMLAAALPLALTGLLQQAYFYADNGFVRAFAGEAELGRYNAAVRLFLWLSFFAAFATTSALPWLARSHAERRLGPATGALALPLFLVAALGAGVLYPCRSVLLGLAFGAGFETAAPSLGWLLLALLAVALGSAFLTAVIAAGRPRAALAIAAGALAVNLLGNALLVPRLGAEGAGLVTLLTEGAVALGALLALRRLGAWPFGRALPFLLAAPLFALGFLAARSWLEPLLVRLLVS